MKFEHIWTEYQAHLKRFLHSRVSDAMEVDDLLQNIMIKIYEKQHTVKSESSVKSWLFQITHNAIIDYYRKKAKTPELSTNDLWYEEIEPNAQGDLADCIIPFIESLSEDSAKLLKEIDINGQSQKQYAQALGISYSTLKSRVQKARNQLRKLFTDCCHLSLDRHGNIIDYVPKAGSCDKC